MPRQKPSEEVLTGLNRLDLPNITDSLNKQAEIIREAERAEKEKRAKEALDKELLTNDSLNKKSLDKDSLNNESLEQESLYKDSLDKESLTVGPLVFGDFGTLDSLDTKDSLVQKETSITKDSLVQNPPTTVEPLVKESLYKESFVEEAADATVLTTDSICKAVQYVLSEQSLTPPARIILSYLLLKQKKYKLFFTYKMLTDGLAFSAPTISSALDSLRSHDYLDVITHRHRGTRINCYRLVYSEQSTKETTVPHDNKYSNLLNKKIFDNNERTKETLVLIGWLAHAIGLTTKDFSVSVMREALKKAIETTIEDVGYAMAYTKKARVISGSSRAGYLHDTLAKKYYDDLDVEVGKKVDDLIPLVKRIYKTHIGDFGRRELVEACGIYNHSAYDQESTEELRKFVQKKLEEGNHFSEKLVSRFFGK